LSPKTYKTIRRELEAYGHGLGDKHEIVALNKIDAIPAAELAKKRKALEKASGGKVFVLSGVSGKGVPDILRALARQISERRAERAERAQARSTRPRIFDATPRLSLRDAAKAKRLAKAEKLALESTANVKGPDVKAKLTKAKLRGKVTSARRAPKKAAR